MCSRMRTTLFKIFKWLQMITDFYCTNWYEEKPHLFRNIQRPIYIWQDPVLTQNIKVGVNNTMHTLDACLVTRYSISSLLGSGTVDTITNDSTLMYHLTTVHSVRSLTVQSLISYVQHIVGLLLNILPSIWPSRMWVQIFWVLVTWPKCWSFHFLTVTRPTASLCPFRPESTLKQN